MTWVRNADSVNSTSLFVAYPVANEVMARVVRSSQAREDLKDIGRYIARESGDRSVATRFVRRIGEKCEQYARQPLMGESRDELATGIRCFPVSSYVVFYEPLDDGILVHTVIHGACDIPAVFRKLLGAFPALRG